MEEKLSRYQRALDGTFNMISRHAKRKMGDENENEFSDVGSEPDSSEEGYKAKKKFNG